MPYSSQYIRKYQKLYIHHSGFQMAAGLAVGFCMGSCASGQEGFQRIMMGGPECRKVTVCYYLGARLLQIAAHHCVWPGTIRHLLPSCFSEMGDGNRLFTGPSSVGRDSKKCGPRLGRHQRRCPQSSRKGPKARGYKVSHGVGESE